VCENFKQKGATIMNHDNTQESAHKIIQLIVSRSKDLKTRPLLHGGLTGNNGGSFTTTPFGEELRAPLEESSDLTYKQLREHRNEEPSKEERRSTDPDVRWRCCDTIWSPGWPRDSPPSTTLLLALCHPLLFI